MSRGVRDDTDKMRARERARIVEAQAVALEEAANERAARSDTYFQTMQNMAETREYELADIVRYGAYSAEAKSTATWLRARAAKIRGGE